MNYEVYADCLFIMNFMVNICLLYLTRRKMESSATLFRLLLGDMLGCLIFMVPLFMGISFQSGVVIGTLAESVVMVVFAFRIKNWQGFLRVLLVFSEYEIAAGGLLALIWRIFPKIHKFAENLGSLLLLAAMVTGGIAFFELRKAEDDFCEVSLFLGEKKIKVTALVDSGNSLREPISRKPASILSESAFDKLSEGEFQRYYRVVPYHSIGKKKGILKGYFIPRMEIEKNGMIKTCKNVCIAVSREGFEEDAAEGKKVELILNPQLFQEKER